MTNEQLAAFLQHIARQINLSVTEVERFVADNPKLGGAVMDLQGLASLLFAQARSMGGTLPSGNDP